MAACGKKAPTWQEQYDLGVRYLSEGNYEEAIIAFTAAIEIDPKQASAFVCRGNAYASSVSEHSEETSEDEVMEIYALAEADYLLAIDLDTSFVEAYDKLADIYIAIGDTEKAIAILEQGYEATGDAALHSRRQKLGFSGSDEVVWTDPVFERLIREEIGIPTGPVYVRDLDDITEIHIYGDTFALLGEYDYGNYGFRYIDSTSNPVLTAYYGCHITGAEKMYTERGMITNVDSLKFFRHLTSVFIIANHITDISVLRDLNNLEWASFWANDISDLSPLHELPEEYDPMDDEQFVEIGDYLTVDY